MKVTSKGCPSCIATIIPHLLKIPGVKGARVLGGELVVLLDDRVDPLSIVRDPVVDMYYRIIQWSIKDVSEIGNYVYSYKLQRR